MNGNKLRNLRENQGLLQKELADRLDISASTIGMYEQGRRQPDNDTLKKISQFFGVSIDYLLDNEIPNTNLKDNELKEIEALKKALQKSGFLSGEEDLTDEELEKVMKFVSANKEFLKGNK